LLGTNALAYYEKSQLTAEKSFTTLAADGSGVRAGGLLQAKDVFRAGQKLSEIVLEPDSPQLRFQAARLLAESDASAAENRRDDDDGAVSKRRDGQVPKSAQSGSRYPEAFQPAQTRQSCPGSFF